MRCLTLANALHERGAEITFMCREHPGHLYDKLELSNHRLIRLPPSTPSTGGELSHANWLGATQEEDARQTVGVLKAMADLDWLVVDHYALDIEWETAMRPHVKRIIVIDDLADRKHNCDVLLDQNLHQDMQERYDDLVPPSCTKLLGPKYALLRPEFKEARKNLRTRDGSIKRIFVFFGGSDSTNETGKALRAIQQLNRADIAIDVVVGATNPHQEDIAKLCRQLPEAKLYRRVNNIAELMAKADLAIGAGGSTTWERCVLGLPTMAISLADNQVSIAKGVDQAGAQIYLGVGSEVTSEILAAQIKQLQDHPQSLISMSEAGQRLVDLNGCDRVSDAIKEAA